jgi:hypothetical protein
MSLNDRQTLLQLLRTPRFWLTTMTGGVELALKFHVLPLSGIAHDIAFLVAFVALLAGIVGVGVWQPAREDWGHPQRLRESMRLILAGKQPLRGYEYLLDAPPPWAKAIPAPLPPPPEDKS